MRRQLAPLGRVWSTMKSAIDRGRIAAICTCLCEFGCDILAQVEPSPMPSSSTR